MDTCNGTFNYFWRHLLVTPWPAAQARLCQTVLLLHDEFAFADELVRAFAHTCTGRSPPCPPAERSTCQAPLPPRPLLAVSGGAVAGCDVVAAGESGGAVGVIVIPVPRLVHIRPRLSGQHTRRSSDGNGTDSGPNWPRRGYSGGRICLRSERQSRSLQQARGNG